MRRFAIAGAFAVAAANAGAAQAQGLALPGANDRTEHLPAVRNSESPRKLRGLFCAW